MTDAELDALMGRVETLGDVPCSDIVDAITTLRAQLAQERANALEAQQTWPIWALEIKDKLQSYGVDPGDEWNVAEQFEGWIDEVVSDESTRADRAEAALAAQIEVDAAICTDIIGYDCMKADGETYQPMWVQKVAKGMVSLARQDIRNQPHDRTALDRYREKALREAYDSLFKHPGFIHAISGQKFKAVKLEDAAEGILALIEVKP